MQNKKSAAQSISTPDLLAGITIVDLSHRLPGPYAGQLLARLGAHVIKIEDKSFGDPFNTSEGPFAHDPSFRDWYQQLNADKEVLQMDFSNEQNIQEIQRLVRGADGVIMGLPEKLQKKMLLSGEHLHHMGPLVVVHMRPSKGERTHGMHDLNALAETGLLELHLKTVEANNKTNAKWTPPPFLPIAGVGFGHYLATSMLAAMVKARKNKDFIEVECYLKETTQELYGPLYGQSLRTSGQTSFLHNGRYPCYNIYYSEDHVPYALAAVEQKFWNNFCKTFELDLSEEQRFLEQTDKAGKQVFEKVAKAFKSHSSNKIDKLTAKVDLCLSRIGPEKTL